MRVLFILPHPIEGPSGRFRVYNYFPYLSAKGVEAHARPFMDSEHIVHLLGKRRLNVQTMGAFTHWTLRRLGDLVGARRWDAVVLHRDAFPFGPPVLEALLTRASRRLIFDFDDFIFERSRIFRTFWERLKDSNKAARVIGMADHTIAGNEFLRKHALRYSPKVSVLPTVVDTQLYVPPTARAGHHPVTVGWIGTPSSAAYLHWLLPVFEQVARRCTVRFHCVGCDPVPTTLPIRFTPWSLAGECADLAGFDIGVMPLFDDEEARGKCGLKLLQYMAFASVAVASPVGVNQEIIQHGVNGLLANTQEEWVEALVRLVQDANWRAQLGAEGRRTVEARYSINAMGPRLLDILHETCDSPRARA